MGNKIGIIGGLGPMATVYFMQRIVEMTEASSDQEHIEIITYNVPSIPDRTSYILGKVGVTNPGPVMRDINKKLEMEEPTCVAIPCMTAHHFYDEVKEGVKNEVIHGIQETRDYLKGLNVKRVGLMATDGTIKTQLFQKELEKNGIELITPKVDDQKDVMTIIYDQAKCGKPIDIDLFYKVSHNLKEDGAEVIILGCTEFSLVKKEFDLEPGYLDVIDVLARACVTKCNKLRESFENILT